MLTIRVERGRDGQVTALQAFGHAGFDRRGRDIVCAGASAVVHTAVLGVTQAVGLPAAVEAGDGYLEIRLDAERRPPGQWERAQAVLEAAILGAKEIARQYPRHVRVEDPPAPGPRGREERPR